MRSATHARRLARALPPCLLAATCVLAIIGRVPGAFAAAGDLDPGFGIGGKLTTDFGFGGDDGAYTVVVQPDGKIVTAGQCLGSFCVVRHNADGSLDDGGPDDSTPGDAFGTAGSVVTSFAPPFDHPFRIFRQLDGKLVVAGSCGLTAPICIVRYDSDGGLDGGFGTNGTMTSTAGGGLTAALQTDGKIVIAGGCAGDSCVVRFNADGSLDDGGAGDATPGDVFGTGGVVKTNFSPGIDQFNAVAVDTTSGKIVAAGACQSGNNLNICLARYNPNGSLDTNSDADPSTQFNAGGTALLDFGGADAAKAVLIAPNGKVVVGGRCAFNLAGSFCVARLNADGTLDTASDADPATHFGSVGGVITSIELDSDLADLALQPDGKIVALGRCDPGSPTDSVFCLVRYNPDGSLDTDSDADPATHFGAGGKVTAAIKGGDIGVALVRQANDGKLVAVGTCQGTSPDFCIVRYDAQGALDPSFGGSGFVLEDFGGGNDVASAIVRQPNDKVVVAGTRNGEFCAARYDLDGSLDPTFGSAGLVVTAVPGGGGAAALVRQTDGKLVAAGQCNGHFCLVRWNVDGSLDDGGASDSTPSDTFGTAGIMVSAFTPSDSANALVLQPDGKLVAAGACGSTRTFCVARYNVNGSLDDGGVNDATPADAFGSGGRVLTDFASGQEIALALVRQPGDGKLVVAGTCENGSANDICVARYNVNGSLDDGSGGDSTPGDAFGTAGKVITDVAGVDTLRALALQADGRLVAAGSANFAKSFLVRYNPDGSLDGGGAGDATPGDSFGVGGKVLTDATPGNEQYFALTIQPSDGKIVAAGACGDAAFFDELCVARYTPVGTLDGGFGTGGVVNTQFFAKMNGSAAGVALLGDERIVAAGACFVPGRQNDFCVTRYFGNALMTPGPTSTPTPSKTASRTPTPAATLTLGGGTPAATSTGGSTTIPTTSATPTPVATRTPAPENCSDCLDNDFDGAVDRADSDCVPPANGAGAGLAGAAAKAALTCEKALVKAGSSFVAKRLKSLGACLQKAFACVEQQASDAGCLAKAGAACAKADAARRTAATKLTTAILARCDAPAFAAADLIAMAGLGFSGEQDGCSEFGVPLLQTASDVAGCVAARDTCRVDALIGTAVPRARALLALAGRDPAVDASCLPSGGTGGAAADGKRLVKCQKGIANAGITYAGLRLSARQKCVSAVLGCVQLKPGDAPCRAKAGVSCDKLRTKVAAASAKVASAVAKACGSPLAFSDVVAAPGVGFGLRAGECQALGIPTLDSAGALAACLTAAHDCRVDQLVEGQTPRATELEGLVP